MLVSLAGDKVFGHLCPALNVYMTSGVLVVHRARSNDWTKAIGRAND